MVVDADVPPLVRLDANLPLCVVENGVTNAARYGPRDGRVRVRAMRAHGRLRLEVANEPGAKHAENRALYGDGDALKAIVAGGGRGLQRDAASTGQGLRIAAMCARLLGGELTLHFLADKVVVALVVPLIAVDAAASTVLPDGLRVASLDDDEFVRVVDRHLFKQLGFKAHVRGESVEEIEGFPAFVATLDPPPHVVFLDQVPLLDWCT